jgi:hypothetical protein
MSERQLVRAIKVHIAEGDKAKDEAFQHYIAAGLHLWKLKRLHDGRGGTWAEWEQLLKTKIGIGKSRASELMRIADGRKSVEEVRERSNESSAASHAKARELSCSPLISGEQAVDPEASADAMKAKLGMLDDEPADDGDAQTKEPPPTAPAEPPRAEVQKLIRAWVQASPEVKRQFVRERWDEIARARKQLDANGGVADQDRWIEEDTL